METICEDTSSHAVFWSGLWNLVTTTDWTTDDFSTTLPVLVDSALAMLPNHSKQAQSLVPLSVAELPAAQSSEAALPATQSSDAGPNTPMSLFNLHKCFKTISDTPNVLKTHTQLMPEKLVDLKNRIESEFFREGRASMPKDIEMLPDGGLRCPNMASLNLPFWGKVIINYKIVHLRSWYVC